MPTNTSADLLTDASVGSDSLPLPKWQCILESLHFISSGLSEKRAANALWNGELEAELRERGALDMYGMLHSDSDREVIIEHIDNLRAKINYLHQPEDCTVDCKARGN